MNTPAAKQKIADGAMTIPCTSATFIRNWLEVMRPVHKLSNREMDVAACLINKRYELKKKVNDPLLVDKVLFDRETKNAIIKELDITNSYFKMVLHELRKNNVIIGERVNPKYLPDFTPGKPFRWMFIFKNED